MNVEYEPFTRTRMPWQRSDERGNILLSTDDGSLLFALTPAAAEDLAHSLLIHAAAIRAYHR